MRIRETIHHGDYRNVREADIEPTWNGFVAFYLDSPYSGGETVESIAGNKYFAQTFASITSKGKGHRGWAAYEVVTNQEEQ